MKRNYWIGILFIAGLTTILFPHMAERVNTHIQASQVVDFQDSVAEKSSDMLEKELDLAAICNDEIYYDNKGLHDPFEDSHDKLEKFKDCLGIDDDEVFSAIEIPKLELMIPIYLGSSDDILNKGVGQVEGSSLPLGGKNTHSVLAAHRGMGTKEMWMNLIQEMNLSFMVNQVF